MIVHIVSVCGPILLRRVENVRKAFHVRRQCWVSSGIVAHQVCVYVKAVAVCWIDVQITSLEANGYTRVAPV